MVFNFSLIGLQINQSNKCLTQLEDNILKTHLGNLILESIFDSRRTNQRKVFFNFGVGEIQIFLAFDNGDGGWFIIIDFPLFVILNGVLILC